MAPVIDLDHEGMHSETISHGILFICIAIGLLLFIFALFLCCYEIISMRMCMRWRKKKGNRYLPPPLSPEPQHQPPPIVAQIPDNSPMVNQEATQELKASPEIGATTRTDPEGTEPSTQDLGLYIYTPTYPAYAVPKVDVEIGFSSGGISESNDVLAMKLEHDNKKSEEVPGETKTTAHCI